MCIVRKNNILIFEFLSSVWFIFIAPVTLNNQLKIKMHSLVFYRDSRSIKGVAVLAIIITVSILHKVHTINTLLSNYQYVT